MGKKSKKSNSVKQFDPAEFEEKLANLMASLKSWGEEGDDDDALEAVWSAYLEFRKPYKRFAKAVPEPGDIMHQLFESISDFLVRANREGIDPDKFF